jgi:hypothetical protein
VLLNYSNYLSIIIIIFLLKLYSNDKLRKLQCFLDSEGYTIILDGAHNGTTSLKTIKRDQLYGIVNGNDLLEFITSK